MRIEILSTETSHQRLEQIWAGLSTQQFSHLCNSFRWQTIAKEAYFPHQKTQLIAIYVGKEVIGLLPMVKNKGTFMRLPASRYLTFEQSINFSDIMIHPDYLQEALTLLIRDYETHFPDSSFVKLTASGRSIEKVNQLFRSLKDSIQVLMLDRNSRLIELNKGQDFLQDILPKKRRTNYRRSLKLLSEGEEPIFEHLYPQTEAVIENCWKRFLEIYRQSWKHTSPRSITSVSAEKQFFHQVFRQFAREKKLYCSFLKLNAQDIAMSWSVEHGNSCYGLQTAYLSEFERSSPGATCMIEHLSNYFKNGGSRFDLMGEHAYKNQISNLSMPYCDYYLFFNTPYSTILRMLSRYSPLRFRKF